jgi:hypothetical protein
MTETSDQTKTLGQAVQSVITAAASPRPSTPELKALIAHKRAFLETFRRWERLFKRKDSGDVESEMWLVAEYFDSLGHLSADGLAVLTRQLKETCTFFPSVRECLALIKCGPADYGHPFYAATHLIGTSAHKPLFLPRQMVAQIAASPRREAIEGPR